MTVGKIKPSGEVPEKKRTEHKDKTVKKQDISSGSKVSMGQTSPVDVRKEAEAMRQYVLSQIEGAPKKYGTSEVNEMPLQMAVSGSVGGCTYTVTGTGNYTARNIVLSGTTDLAKVGKTLSIYAYAGHTGWIADVTVQAGGTWTYNMDPDAGASNKYANSTDYYISCEGEDNTIDVQSSSYPVDDMSSTVTKTYNTDPTATLKIEANDKAGLPNGADDYITSTSFWLLVPNDVYYVYIKGASGVADGFYATSSHGPGRGVQLSLTDTSKGQKFQNATVWLYGQHGSPHPGNGASGITGIDAVEYDADGNEAPTLQDGCSTVQNGSSGNVQSPPITLNPPPATNQFYIIPQDTFTPAVMSVTTDSGKVGTDAAKVRYRVNGGAWSVQNNIGALAVTLLPGYGDQTLEIQYGDTLDNYSASITSTVHVVPDAPDLNPPDVTGVIYGLRDQGDNAILSYDSVFYVKGASGTDIDFYASNGYARHLSKVMVNGVAGGSPCATPTTYNGRSSSEGVWWSDLHFPSIGAGTEQSSPTLFGVTFYSSDESNPTVAPQLKIVLDDKAPVIVKDGTGGAASGVTIAALDKDDRPVELIAKKFYPVDSKIKITGVTGEKVWSAGNGGTLKRVQVKHVTRNNPLGTYVDATLTLRGDGRYDVLANVNLSAGENTLTLEMEDLAGNLTTTTVGSYYVYDSSVPMKAWIETGGPQDKEHPVLMSHKLIVSGLSVKAVILVLPQGGIMGGSWPLDLEKNQNAIHEDTRDGQPVFLIDLDAPELHGFWNAVSKIGLAAGEVYLVDATGLQKKVLKGYGFRAQ